MNRWHSQEIEQELTEARAALASDARAAVGDARSLVGWRRLVHDHPWAFCGGASVLGYLLVPRRRADVGASADFEEAPAQAALGPSGKGPHDGLLRACLEVTLATIVQQSFAYLSQQQQRQAGPSEQPVAQTARGPDYQREGMGPTPIEPNGFADMGPGEPEHVSKLREHAERAVHATGDYVKRTVAEHPKPALAVAAVAGLVLGWMVKRR